MLGRKVDCQVQRLGLYAQQELETGGSGVQGQPQSSHISRKQNRHARAVRKSVLALALSRPVDPLILRSPTWPPGPKRCVCPLFAHGGGLLPKTGLQASPKPSSVLSPQHGGLPGCAAPPFPPWSRVCLEKAWLRSTVRAGPVGCQGTLRPEAQCGA